jgi:uncharacterized membrane protein HdeD (DUF308 family)
MEVMTRMLGILLLVIGAVLFVTSYERGRTLNPIVLSFVLLNVGLGLLLALFPSLVAGAFIVILGIIALLSGLTNLILLIRSGNPLIGLAVIRNVIVALFGIYLLVNPDKGQEGFAIVIGIFTVLFGILSLYNGYRLFIVKKKL